MNSSTSSISSKRQADSGGSNANTPSGSEEQLHFSSVILNMTSSANSSSISYKRPANSGGSNTNSPKKLRNSESEEESHLNRLFAEALEIIQKKMNVSNEELKRGIETVMDAFRYYKGNQFSDIDFTKSENLCAYFYRLSPLSAGLARIRIQDAANSCNQLQSCLNCKEINVTSLGGGPGCDIIGFCSTLHDAGTCRKINLTIVDSVKRWNSFLNVQEFLLREGDFGNASNMFQNADVRVSFLCEDVSRQQIVSSRALREADVVLLKSLLSILSHSQKYLVAQNVVQGMKVGALLLFIDSPYYEFQSFGLERVYTSVTERDPLESSVYIGEKFFLRTSPVKNYGQGIAQSSNAQMAVFVKNNP